MLRNMNSWEKIFILYAYVVSSPAPGPALPIQQDDLAN